MTTNYNEAIGYNSAINYNGGQPIITPKILPTFGLRVISKDGDVSPLPEAMIESVSFEDSGPSAISVNVANTSVGAELLGDLSILELTINGAAVQDGRWLVRGQNWNEGTKAQVKSFTGKHLLWDRLEHTIVWNDRRYLYSSKTVGYILNDLFFQAQQRDVGYWDQFTWTFNATNDSAGRAWPGPIGSIEYLPTAKYNDVVANLVDKGVLEIHLVGNEIRAYVPDTFGKVTPSLLVVGEDVTDAPQQSSADNLVSDVMMLGDDNVTVTRSNPTTRTLYWREESGISQGGTKDVGTLSVFGDVALSAGDGPRIQRTYDLVLTQERPFLPIRDYLVSDWVRVQHADTPAQSFRVKQIVLKRDAGVLKGTLVLNDKFIENELRLVKKVDGIIGGATITGSSQTSPDPQAGDPSVPNPPTGVGGSAIQYIDGNGNTQVLATFSWAPPVTNTDGTPVTDLDHYRAAWKYADLDDDVPWQWRDTDGLETSIAISPLDPGRQLLFYVRAIDKVGWWSGNQPSPYVLDLGFDTIPPPTPSLPLTASILRQFIVEWDGLDSNGLEMPPDFRNVEVWSSPVSGFTPGDPNSDFHGTLDHAGQLFITAYGYDIGETAYFKLVAVDRSGNRSGASAQNSDPLEGVKGPDITAGSITANNLAVGSVTAQAIAAGAITSQKINIGQTQNLVVDPSFNDPDWRLRRKTTEWAEKPSFWFFTTGFIDRNGYYLQALSSPNEGGGRMYMTDWMYTQLGESYYVGIYARNGQFTPNPEAAIRLGVEVTHKDGTVQSDGINYATFAEWLKYGYRFTIVDERWTKLRFYIQAIDLTAGDIAIDDWEVRGGVGTTEYAGSRGLIDPLGFFAYDADDNLTVDVDFRTGDATFRGTIKSGFTGKRIEVNPSTTYLPEIRFYPAVGEQFAYINASDNVLNDFPFIGVNAPDNAATNISNAMILWDTSTVMGAINKSTGEVQSGVGVYGMTKVASEVALYGKLAYSTEGHRMFSGGKLNCGIPAQGTNQTLAAVFGKPSAPPSGTQWMLMFTPQRNAADKFFAMPTGETGTSTTVGFYPNTTWATNPSVTMFANFMFVRVDV
jgi:hypothetical protein